MSKAVIKKYEINSPGTTNKVNMAKDATIITIEKPKADENAIFIHAVIDPDAKPEVRLVYLVKPNDEINEKAGVHHALLKFGTQSYHVFTEY